MKHLDCEIFIAGRDQARLTVAGKDYSGRPALDSELERRLLEASLDPTAYGRQLFEAIFPDSDDLVTGYRESLAIARRENQRLRLRLHVAITAPQALNDLRWELLYDPRRGIALSRSSEIAFSRYLGTVLEPVAAVVGRPRLLVVVSSPSDLADYGLPVIDHGQQRRALERALSPLAERLTVDFFTAPATVEGVRDRLVAGEFHALHLQAHGHLDSDRESASLVMEDENRRANFIGEELFSEVFEGRRNLRLVSLIACHGGAPSGTDPFSGLGRALVRRGVPAVLAMRQQIDLDSAARFAEHFYLNLARSGQIDDAANEARLQMYLAAPEATDWGTPALFMRLREGRLWVPGTQPPTTPRSTEDREEARETVLRTLVTVRSQPPHGGAKDYVRRCARLIRDLLPQHDGREIGGDDHLLVFERPIQAVGYALACHLALDGSSRTDGREITAGIAIHLGEILLRENPARDVARGARPFEVEGPTLELARRLLPIPSAKQTLLTRAAFDVARSSSLGTAEEARELLWLAHGEYHLPGYDEPVEIFEVGVEGFAPLETPPDSEKLSRSLGQETIPGWRPAPELALPGRPHWKLERRLGEGGFGEVWLAAHRKTGERRAFKFCYEASRLRALQREITLFRLLKEELGNRDDIARILDWNFERAPYFIESEYAADGDLAEWAEEQGGIAAVPMEQRLEIVAQVAAALAAAHSVGVLHKDVKPTNVLIAHDPDGGLKVQLSDFGIGAVTGHERLAAAGITVLGLTTKTEQKPSSASGTRLYMAPELLEGKRATLQTDIYALGVMLYQMIVGDLTKALASGWQRDVEDELLREDIAFAVDGSPAKRLGNALRLAERLRALESRQQKREEEHRQQLEARQAKEALNRARKRRKLTVAVIGVLTLFGGAMMYQNQRIAAEKERTALQADRANREAEVAQEIYKFMIGLFKVSDPQIAKGETITARQLLEAGAAKIRDELTGQPLTQARLMDTMGTVYHQLGLYESAEVLLVEALKIRQEHLGEAHPEVASSLNNLAILYTNQGRFQEAEPLYRQALEILEESEGVDPLDVAATADNLGVNYQKQQRYEESVRFCRRALEIRTETLGPDHPQVARSLNNLAEIYNIQGRHQEAEQLFRHALDIKERILGPRHLNVAIGQNNLAEVYMAQSRPHEAETYFLRALETFEELLEPNHLYIAYPLHGLATIYSKNDRPGEAEPLYRRALAVRAALPPDDPDRQKTLRAYAKLLRSMDREDEARELEN